MKKSFKINSVLCRRLSNSRSLFETKNYTFEFELEFLQKIDDKHADTIIKKISPVFDKFINEFLQGKLICHENDKLVNSLFLKLASYSNGNDHASDVERLKGALIKLPFEPIGRNLTHYFLQQICPKRIENYPIFLSKLTLSNKGVVEGCSEIKVH